jgi:hypothetical protein
VLLLLLLVHQALSYTVLCHCHLTQYPAAVNPIIDILQHGPVAAMCCSWEDSVRLLLLLLPFMSQRCLLFLPLLLLLLLLHRTAHVLLLISHEGTVNEPASSPAASAPGSVDSAHALHQHELHQADSTEPHPTRESFQGEKYIFRRGWGVVWNAM